MSSGKTVVVGCKLPHGLIINHPLDPSRKVTLNGPNSSRIVGAQYGMTEVDQDFWETWITLNSKFPAVLSNAIFEASSRQNLEAVAKELENQKTGFEPMPKNAHGVTAMSAE